MMCIIMDEYLFGGNSVFSVVRLSGFSKRKGTFVTLMATARVLRNFKSETLARSDTSHAYYFHTVTVTGGTYY
jgi:hypothetical protein